MKLYFTKPSLLVFLLLLFVGKLFAQTTITLPAACSDCKTSTNGAAIVSSFGGVGCTAGSSGTLNGTYSVGQAVTSANTMTLYANVTQIGSWNINTAVSNGVSFSGNGNFTATGCQQITLTASGTPIVIGPLIATTNTTPAGSASTMVGNLSTNGDAVITSLGGVSCTGNGTINGTLIQGVAVSAVTMTLSANVSQVGSWNLSATQNGVTFSGTGTFTNTGCQPITLIGKGTPTAIGPFTWTTNSSPVGNASATVVPASNASQFSRASAGNFSGKSCFDIARSTGANSSCGPVESRFVNKSDFTLASVNTQTYTFTPGGTVSNVRFEYVNTNGTVITGITGGNAGSNITSAVTATVSYNNNLNNLALGLTNSNPLTADIYVIFNDGSGDKTLKLTTNVKDCGCCGAYIALNVWKEFLCHNLGADILLDPHQPSVGIYGAAIQWGKRGPNITGDSRIDWQTAPNDGPNGFAATLTGLNQNNYFSVPDWNVSVTAPNILLWNKGTATAPIKGVNDPCPAGYRLPTINEMLALKTYNSVSTIGPYSNDFTSFNSAKKYGPNLTLPAAGFVGNASAGNRHPYARGDYWVSSTVAGELNFNSTDQALTNQLPTNTFVGMSVRCIAE